MYVNLEQGSKAQATLVPIVVDLLYTAYRAVGICA